MSDGLALGVVHGAGADLIGNLPPATHTADTTFTSVDTTMQTADEA